MSRYGLLLVLASVLCACGDGGEPPVAAPGDAGSGASDSMADADSGQQVEARFLVGTVIAAETGEPIVDAEVCEATSEPPACVASGADGGFELGVPEGDLELRWSAASYRSGRLLLVGHGDAELVLPTLSDALWGAQEASGSGDASGGVLARFFASDEAGNTFPLEGVTSQIVGGAGVDAVYGIMTEPGPGEATDEDGYALFGPVAEGSHALVSTHPAGACAPSQGLAPGGLLVDVVGDHVSVVNFECVVVTSNDVSITGTVWSYTTGAPIAGGEVCLDGESSDSCVLTDDQGRYTLASVPPGVLTAVVVNAPDHEESRTPIIATSETTDVTVWQRPVTEFVIDLQTVPDPEEFGATFMRAFEADAPHTTEGLLSGVSFVLTPAAGIGPVYATGDGEHSSAAPATFASGEGAIMWLPKGTYEVRFTHPWGLCVPGHGLEHAEDGTFSLTIEPGSDTRVTAICDVAPPETSSIIGRVSDIWNGDVIEGAAICLQSVTEAGVTTDELCSFSDENGEYELTGVPSHSIRYIEFSADGYMTTTTLFGVAYGQTYYARLSENSFGDLLVYGPMVAAGICPPVPDWDNWDELLWTARLYDTAYNTDTFFQGEWLDRGRAKLTNLDTGEEITSMVYHGKSGLPDVSQDEVSHIGIMWACDLKPGTYRMSYEHPWGDCTVGAGLPPQEDGGYVAYLLPGVQNNVNGQCTLTPPGTVAEELETYPPLASMKLLMESAGMLEGLSLAELPPAGLVASERMTLFVPSSTALSAFLLDSGQLAPEERRRLIEHHMLQGERELHELVAGEKYWTVAGTPLEFAEDEDGELYIVGSGARIIEAEHWALDGIIHIVDEVLEVPEPAASAVENVYTKPETSVLIDGEQHQVTSWGTGGGMIPAYTVYTPPGYYPDAPYGYPVLYVLHDLGGDANSFFGGETQGVPPSLTLPQVTETLIQSGGLPPMIVVGINGMNGAYGSYFVDSVDEEDETAFGAHQAYVMAIIAEVESEYNTATEPESAANRAVLGHGMGGFGALHLAAAHPWFTAVIVHSGLLSIADLEAPDAIVAATYDDGSVDGTLWSEIHHGWSQVHGDTLLDGRLFDLVGPDAPAISRAVAMASAFSPVNALFGSFDMAGSTVAGEGLVTDLDGDASNNNSYPAFSAEGEGGAPSFDEAYVGFQLPWTADGTLDEAVWERWLDHEPLTALEGASEALVSADTDIFLDCGANDERGLADQTQLFFLDMLTVLGAEYLTLEFHGGDHASALYTERLFASMIWLGQTLAEEESEEP